MTIAHRFQRWDMVGGHGAVPAGTKDRSAWARASDSIAVPRSKRLSSLTGLGSTAVADPSDESLGYSHTVPAGTQRHSCGG